MLGISWGGQTAYFCNSDIAENAMNGVFNAMVESGLNPVKVTDERPVRRRRAERYAEQPQKKQLVRVAFKVYDYEVDEDVKVGDFVTVISGGKPIQLEVLKVHNERQDGISYVSVEEVIHK